MANAIKSYTESKAAESGFYPTPPGLVSRMLAKVDWNYVDSMLEPSAGKGDLALPTIAKWHLTHNHYTDCAKADHPADMDCIEIDGNLRAILKDKGLRVVHDDFLTFNTQKRYSLIVMNPPFEDGARHVLRAISLLEPKGQLIALLNAETVRNPYSNERNLLLRTLGSAEIEYIPDAFLSAERKTDVETAMITYRAPEADLSDSLVLERLRPGHKYVNMPKEEAAALSKADFVEAIIDRYNYEVESGVKLIREYRAVAHMLNESEDSGRSSLSLVIGSNAASENAWVRSVRHKYWSKLFTSPQFVEQLTSNLRQNLFNRVKDLEDYEFSYYNIKEIMIQMTAQVTEGVESTIMKLFDDWTRKYHWDENAQNRHYFDGWRTNDAFAVNKKVILPLRAYDHWGYSFPDEFRAYNVREKLIDIEKVFNYLDGGRTPEKDLREILNEIEKTGNAKKVDSKYFYMTFYKKGTCHLEFKDMNLLAKFNIFAARSKNWLPPSFGRKRYKDLNSEEKRVIDSFMSDKGGKKYDAVCAHADYFLANGSETLNLPA